MPEIFDRRYMPPGLLPEPQPPFGVGPEGLLPASRPIQAYETPQHYYEGPAGANIGERLLSLQREGLSMEMPTFLGQNVSGQWGQYIPDEEYRVVTGNDGGAGFEVHRGGAAIPNIDTINYPLLRQEGSYRRSMTPEQLAELDEFREGQENQYGTRAWLERRYRNAPENWQPPMEAPLAVLLSTQSRPDEVYEGLTPEHNVKIQRTRNVDLQNVARHEAGHHGLALSGVQGEEINRPMDYITTTDPFFREAATKHLGISEPEMIRKFESETDFRKNLNKLLEESNARLIAQGRPPIDNQAVIAEALAERRQALSRAVYPKPNTADLLKTLQNVGRQ